MRVGCFFCLFLILWWLPTIAILNCVKFIMLNTRQGSEMMKWSDKKNITFNNFSLLDKIISDEYAEKHDSTVLNSLVCHLTLAKCILFIRLLLCYCYLDGYFSSVNNCSCVAVWKHGRWQNPLKFYYILNWFWDFLPRLCSTVWHTGKNGTDIAYAPKHAKNITTW